MRLVDAISLFSGAAFVAAKNNLPDGVVNFRLSSDRTGKHPMDRYQTRYPKNQHKRRSDTLDLEIYNVNYQYYSTELKVGTPEQDVVVIVDTGSSDLWFMDKKNPYCTEDEEKAEYPSKWVLCTNNTFDHDKSSSFNKMNQKFEISYVDTSAASGEWAKDTIKYEDVTLEKFQFGMAEVSNSTMPVMGIGLKDIEMTNSGRDGYTYDNFPAALKSGGHIKANAYSLWLNEMGEETGSLLMGGVDHEKYSGQLAKVPLVPSSYLYDDVYELAINLNQISLAGKNEKHTVFESGGRPALLDSGTTITYVPWKVISSIGRALDGDYDGSLEAYVLPCDMSDDLSLEWDFSGAKVVVPITDMLLPLQSTSGGPGKLRDGRLACRLAMDSAYDTYVLGDTFLRAAYVVYDLDNHEIAMASAKRSHDKSNVEAISNGIPSATKASNYDKTEYDSTYSAYSVTLKGDYEQPTSSVKLSDSVRNTRTRTRSASTTKSSTSTSGSSTSTSSPSSSTATSTSSTTFATASAASTGNTNSGSGDSDDDSASGASIAHLSLILPFALGLALLI